MVHHVGVADGQHDLLPNPAGHRMVVANDPSSRIDQPKVLTRPVGRGKVPVARDAGPVVHDRPAPPNDPVEERGLTHVGTPDDSDGRVSHPPPPRPSGESGDVAGGLTNPGVRHLCEGAISRAP